MILYLAYSTKNESYRYLCNHRRAYKLFTDSISPKCKFTAFPCESYEKVYIYTKLVSYPQDKSPLPQFESGQCFSCGEENGECGQLGYRSNLSPGRGSLYLLTREDEPFCGKISAPMILSITEPIILGLNHLPRMMQCAALYLFVSCF